MNTLAKSMGSILNRPNENTGGYLSEIQTLHFNYSQLKDEETIKWLKNNTIECKKRYRRTVAEAAYLGKLLLEVKDRLGHGYFVDWLHEEFIKPKWFGLTSAGNFMRVACAVNKYGLDRIEKIPFSLLYMNSSREDNEEFLEHMIEGYEEYQWTQREAVQEKKKYNLLKDLENKKVITPEQRKTILKTDLSLEEVKVVVNKPPQELKQSIAVLESGNNSTAVAELTSVDNVTEVVPSVSIKDFKYNNLNYPPEMTVRKYNLTFLQGSLNREDSTHFVDHIYKISDYTETLAIVINPLDLLTLKPINNFNLKHVVIVKRNEKRVIPEIDTINHVIMIAVFTKKPRARIIIDDYYPSYELAFSHICEAYTSKSACELLLMACSNTVYYNLYDKDLLHTVNKNYNMTTYY